ncbi:MAG TPA: DNA polymerase III subunit chi [Micavibrio sp.]
MTEIRLYRAVQSSLDQVLPSILAKAAARGQRIVVLLPDKASVERYNELLWTYQADSFLPHGSAKDGHADQQPIWLTDQEENPNGAEILVTLRAENESIPAFAGGFALCCDLVDGRIEQETMAARKRWVAYKAQGHEMTYWLQTEQGWEKQDI